MRRFTALLLVIAVSILLFATGISASEETCNPLGDSDFCVEEVTITDEEIQEGETVLLEIEIRNVGESTSDVRVIYAAELSEGHLYQKLADIENVQPGERVTVSEEAEIVSPGERTLNVVLMNLRDTHLYDSTGYQHSYYASPEPSLSSQIWDFLSRLEVLVSIVVGLFTIGFIFSRKT